MKKILFIFAMLFSGVLLTSFLVSADTFETADVVIHYQNWTGDYEGLGVWGWNGIESQPEFDGEDNFGVYLKRKGVVLDSNKMGFIAVTYKADKSEPDWNNANAKQTQNVEIDKSQLVAGETNHVYIFQGADSTKENTAPGYYVAKNNMYNMLLVYVDPAGSYEENLGVHAWNGFPESAWGSPAQVFTNGSTEASVGNIKVAMLHSEKPDAGLLIYAGGDENKKTGDVKLEEAYKAVLGEKTPKFGDVGFAYVVSKGNAYTVNDNVYYNSEDFVADAFTFKLLPMGQDATGQFTGTYAPKPNQVIVELSANVKSPIYGKKTDEEIKAGHDLVKTWFTVQTGTSTVEIDEVHFNQVDETIGSFVLILKSNLDVTKEYEVLFDLGLTTEENKEASIEINLDREAPTIQFVSDELIGKPEEERIILVAYNKKFDWAKFPQFIATDDRDGDLTGLVYVPKGDFSTLNTNVEGDYTILLRVEDNWGNVTEEKFTFRVTKSVK